MIEHEGIFDSKKVSVSVSVGVGAGHVPIFRPLVADSTCRADGNRFVRPVEAALSRVGLSHAVVRKEATEKLADRLRIFPGSLALGHGPKFRLIVEEPNGVSVDMGNLNVSRREPLDGLKIGEDRRLGHIHQVMNGHQDIPVGAQSSVVYAVDLSVLGPQFHKNTNLTHPLVT